MNITSKIALDVARSNARDSMIVLPCPFCGAKGEIEEGGNDINGNRIFQVVCGDKYGEKGCGVHPQTWWRDSEWEAIKDWNRRDKPIRESSNDGHEEYEEDMK